MKHVLDLKCMAMFMLSFDVTVPVVFVSDGKVGMDKLSKVATSIYKNAPPPPTFKSAGDVPPCLSDQTHLKCSLYSPARKL